MLPLPYRTAAESSNKLHLARSVTIAISHNFEQVSSEATWKSEFTACGLAGYTPVGSADVILPHY